MSEMSPERLAEIRQTLTLDRYLSVGDLIANACELLAHVDHLTAERDAALAACASAEKAQTNRAPMIFTARIRAALGARS